MQLPQQLCISLSLPPAREAAGKQMRCNYQHSSGEYLPPANHNLLQQAWPLLSVLDLHLPLLNALLLLHSECHQLLQHLQYKATSGKPARVMPRYVVRCAPNLLTSEECCKTCSRALDWRDLLSFVYNLLHFCVHLYIKHSSLMISPTGVISQTHTIQALQQVQRTQN